VPADVPADQTTPAVSAGTVPAAEPAAGPAVTEPAPAPSQPLTPANVPLSLSFNGASWVEVTDAGGNVLLSQVARDGDVLQPAGALPLSVVIGDAAHAAVFVRGKPFDLAAVTRANVARFTVR
jgi:cytoskeleton protein RodZ